MDTKEIEFRALNEADRDSFITAAEDFISYMHHFGDYEKIELNICDVFDNILKAEDYIKIIVAVYKKKIIGFIGYSKTFFVEFNERVFYINSFSVIPEFRKQKLGAMLFECLCNRAIKDSAFKVILNVHNNNLGALNFYKRFGMCEVTKEKMLFLKLSPTDRADHG